MMQIATQAPDSAKIMCVSTSGSIGAGKSTFIKRCVDFFAAHPEYRIGIVVANEPVSAWTEVGALELVIEDQPRWSLPFQQMAVTTRCMALEKAAKSARAMATTKQDLYDYVLIITERSHEDDNQFFAKVSYDDKNMSAAEYKLYTQLLELHRARSTVKIDLVVWLDTDFKETKGRIKTRAGEDDSRLCELNYDEDYLRKVQQQHKIAFASGTFHGAQVLRIDGNCAFNTDDQALLKLMAAILTALKINKAQVN